MAAVPVPVTGALPPTVVPVLLDSLLGRDEVSGHDFVYGELLAGTMAAQPASGRLEQMHQPRSASQHGVAFVRDRRLPGVARVDRRASAGVDDWCGRLSMRTIDPARATLRQELGIRHE